MGVPFVVLLLCANAVISLGMFDMPQRHFHKANTSGCDSFIPNRTYFIPNQSDTEVTMPFDGLTMYVFAVEPTNVQALTFRLYNKEDEIWGSYKFTLRNYDTVGRFYKYRLWVPEGFGTISKMELFADAPSCGWDTFSLFGIEIKCTNKTYVAYGENIFPIRVYTFHFLTRQDDIPPSSNSTECRPANQNHSSVEESAPFQFSVTLGPFDRHSDDVGLDNFLVIELHDDNGTVAKFPLFFAEDEVNKTKVTYYLPVADGFTHVTRVKLSLLTLYKDGVLTLENPTIYDRRTKDKCTSQTKELRHNFLNVTVPIWYDIVL